MKNTFVVLLTLACSVAVGQTQKPFGDRVLKKAPTPLPAILRDAETIDGSKKANSVPIANTLLLKAHIVRDSADNVIWVDFKQAFTLANNGRASMAAAALNYLKTLKPILKLNDPAQEIEVGTIEEDELNHTHIRLQQTYKGLPVYGGEMILHAQDNTFTTLNGKHFKTPALQNTTAKITENQAAQTALEDLKQHTTVRELKPNELQILKKQVSETELLIYYPKTNPENAHLAWRMVVRPNFLERWNYFVDAQTRQVLLRQNHTCKLDGPTKAISKDLNGATQTINTYSKNNLFYLLDTSRPMFNNVQSSIPNSPVGAILTLDAGGSRADDISLSYITSSVNSWSPTAVSAHNNAGYAYNYYLTVHKRNGLDGKGGNMLSVINVKDEKGKEMDNAFWNGEVMAYGNGLQDFTPLAGGLDVAAHEMTHAVTENTARLEYDTQSGALNESMSDVFGVLMDRANWTIGETVAKRSVFQSGALRDMANPNQGGTNDNGYQPKTMAQYVNTTQDDGGVHINSGIPNYAFYLFASNASVGKDKAEKVYYRVLTTYLTRYSQFKDMRVAVIKAASDLYGATSNEVKAAQTAFDQVGITDLMTQNPTPAQTTLPTNSGTEFLLVYGADDKLYSTSTTGGNIVVKSSRAIVNRPSVTDDGKLVYVVNADKKIRAISLVGNPDETVVSTETVWNKVAISKDGKKMAALTEQADKTIYVYSFELQTWKKFLLSNPSYSGISTSDVQYADGLEWDASGEYLVYDAFNKIKTTNGNSLEYWDLGIIRVWNAVDGGFGDGKIQKVFSDLQASESVGNPTFAKNSTAILSFDYLLDDNKTYGVFGIDLEKNTIKAIANNNTLGYPDYARLDDKLVYVAKGADGKNNISVIGLNADKISPKGTASTLLSNGKWPLWVSQGTRPQPTINFAAINDRFENTPPFTLSATASTNETVLFKVISGPATISGNKLTISGAGTVVVRAYTQPGRVFYPIVIATQTFQVVAILSTNPLLDQATQVYPNPVQDILTVRTTNNSPIEQIELLDITGKAILSKQNKTKLSEIQIDTKQIPTGQYQIGIQTSKGMVWKKIIKE
jgi:Zn-dependent metalloprotease